MIYWEKFKRLLNSVWSLYTAVGILFLTMGLGYYVDYTYDVMRNSNMEIRVAVEKINRLSIQLTDSVSLAVAERNIELVRRYDSILYDLKGTIGHIIKISTSPEIREAISAINESNEKIVKLQREVLDLIGRGGWIDARGVISSKEYANAKESNIVDGYITSAIILEKLDTDEKQLFRMRTPALIVPVCALLFLLSVGFLFSRRTRSDMEEQLRLRMEIEAVNMNLEKRIADRTEELRTYSLELEEKANLDATLSRLNMRIQTAQNASDVAKYALDTMVGFFKAPRGAIFIAEAGGRLNRLASYALPAHINITNSFRMGEGTIGKCALKGAMMFTAPKDESFWMEFGIGTAVPIQVLTYPIKSSGTLVGVVELCLIEPISDRQVKWLEKASESIATVLRIAIEREERQAAEERIRLILTSTDEGILGMDTEGYTTFVNPAACAMLGYEEGEVIGKNFHALSHHSRADGTLYPEDKCTMGRALTGECVQGIDTEVLWRHDGTMLPVEYSVTPIYKENEVIGSVVSFRDITERKRIDSMKVEKDVAEEAAMRAEQARQEAEQAQEELKAKIQEVERFNRLALGREERIIELKRQINALAVKMGEGVFYKEHELSEGFDDQLAKELLSPIESEQSEIVSYDLSDILNLQQFQELLTDFCDSVGIASAIINLKGEVLAAARWQRACTDFHRVNEKTCARCIESDTDLALRLNEGKPFSIYQCKNGLTDAASPIIIEGKHVANTFVGQFFTSPPDLGFFSIQAKDCGLDEEKYLEAIKEVPVIDVSKLEPILGFLVRMAQIVASMSIERYRALQAELSITQSRDDLNREKAAAINLAEDAELSRMELQRFKENLEMIVQERTDELERRAHELEEFNKVMINRETRVIELKEEINALCSKLGQFPAYPPVWEEVSELLIDNDKERGREDA